ncbi:Arm DNA-binding domain-containing protein [Gluconacetobacter diazotrophicus]|nr:Arm DNA-binding domain-containing protein [Gluconacetobacter diazotrophicus]
MMLTDTAIKTAEAQDKAFRLADSEGLFIHVPMGKKFWFMPYRPSVGKKQKLTFGPYPLH